MQTAVRVFPAFFPPPVLTFLRVSLQFHAPPVAFFHPKRKMVSSVFLCRTFIEAGCRFFFLSFLHNPWLWDMGEGTPPPVVRLRWRVRATWIRSHCLLFFDEFFRNASPPRQRKGWRRRSYGKTRKKEGGGGPRKRSGDHLTKSNDASHLSFGPASFLSSSPSFSPLLQRGRRQRKEKSARQLVKEGNAAE